MLQRHRGMYAGFSSPKQPEVYDRGTAHLLMRAMSSMDNVWTVELKSQSNLDGGSAL
jgi:hypothetical protein